ncbi:hypothetical protein PAUR_b0862 [Pseudoalteromonas aurantia 208]|uniref:Uncharacterized protein n=1 Tax=Pseudoalteromonas aurantia 208 TaxID=1314867 RepID=A0ABR9EIE4_9GAMM|nr:hypothetical protein [Pseudoalteromonas aurantia 208]
MKYVDKSQEYDGYLMWQLPSLGALYMHHLGLTFANLTL